MLLPPARSVSGDDVVDDLVGAATMLTVKDVDVDAFNHNRSSSRCIVNDDEAMKGMLAVLLLLLLLLLCLLTCLLIQDDLVVIDVIMIKMYFCQYD
jgi:hypothetical protein